MASRGCCEKDYPTGIPCRDCPKYYTKREFCSGFGERVEKERSSPYYNEYAFLVTVNCDPDLVNCQEVVGQFSLGPYYRHQVTPNYTDDIFWIGDQHPSPLLRDENGNPVKVNKLTFVKHSNMVSCRTTRAGNTVSATDVNSFNHNDYNMFVSPLNPYRRLESKCLSLSDENCFGACIGAGDICSDGGFECTRTSRDACDQARGQFFGCGTNCFVIDIPTYYDDEDRICAYFYDPALSLTYPDDEKVIVDKFVSGTLFVTGDNIAGVIAADFAVTERDCIYDPTKVKQQRIGSQDPACDNVHRYLYGECYNLFDGFIDYYDRSGFGLKGCGQYCTQQSFTDNTIMPKDTYNALIEALKNPKSIAGAEEFIEAAISASICPPENRLSCTPSGKFSAYVDFASSPATLKSPGELADVYRNFSRGNRNSRNVTIQDTANYNMRDTIMPNTHTSSGHGGMPGPREGYEDEFHWQGGDPYDPLSFFVTTYGVDITIDVWRLQPNGMFGRYIHKSNTYLNNNGGQSYIDELEESSEDPCWYRLGPPPVVYRPQFDNVTFNTNYDALPDQPGIDEDGNVFDTSWLDQYSGRRYEPMVYGGLCTLESYGNTSPDIDDTPAYLEGKHVPFIIEAGVIDKPAGWPSDDDDEGCYELMCDTEAKVNILFSFSASNFGFNDLTDEEENLYVCGASTISLSTRQTAYQRGYTSIYGDTWVSCPNGCSPLYVDPFSCYYYYDYYCDDVDDRGTYRDFWYDFPTPIFNPLGYSLDDPDAGEGTPVEPDIMDCCNISFIHNPATIMPGVYNASQLNFTDGYVRLAGPAPVWRFPFGRYTELDTGYSGGTVRGYPCQDPQYDDEGRPTAVDRYGACACCWQNEIEPSPRAIDMPASRGQQGGCDGIGANAARITSLNYLPATNRVSALAFERCSWEYNSLIEESGDFRECTEHVNWEWFQSTLSEFCGWCRIDSCYKNVDAESVPCEDPGTCYESEDHWHSGYSGRADYYNECLDPDSQESWGYCYTDQFWWSGSFGSCSRRYNGCSNWGWWGWWRGIPYIQCKNTYLSTINKKWYRPDQQGYITEPFKATSLTSYAAPGPNCCFNGMGWNETHDKATCSEEYPCDPTGQYPGGVPVPPNNNGWSPPNHCRNWIYEFQVMRTISMYEWLNEMGSDKNNFGCADGYSGYGYDNFRYNGNTDICSRNFGEVINQDSAFCAALRSVNGWPGEFKDPECYGEGVTWGERSNQHGACVYPFNAETGEEIKGAGAMVIPFAAKQTHTWELNQKDPTVVGSAEIFYQPNGTYGDLEDMQIPSAYEEGSPNLSGSTVFDSFRHPNTPAWTINLEDSTTVKGRWEFSDNNLYVYLAFIQNPISERTFEVGNLVESVGKITCNNEYTCKYQARCQREQGAVEDYIANPPLLYPWPCHNTSRAASTRYSIECECLEDYYNDENDGYRVNSGSGQSDFRMSELMRSVMGAAKPPFSDAIDGDVSGPPGLSNTRGTITIYRGMVPCAAFDPDRTEDTSLYFSSIRAITIGGGVEIREAPSINCQGGDNDHYSQQTCSEFLESINMWTPSLAYYSSNFRLPSSSWKTDIDAIPCDAYLSCGFGADTCANAQGYTNLAERPRRDDEGGGFDGERRSTGGCYPVNWRKPLGGNINISGRVMSSGEGTKVPCYRVRVGWDEHEV